MTAFVAAQREKGAPQKRHRSGPDHPQTVLSLLLFFCWPRYIRGGKRKNLTGIWRSNLNMAEVLGWGLSRQAAGNAVAEDGLVGGGGGVRCVVQ